MKTEVCIPGELFEAAEHLACRLGLSRSELYQRALANYLESQDDAAVTERLDRAYADEKSGGLDAALDSMQRRSLVRENW